MRPTTSALMLLVATLVVCGLVSLAIGGPSYGNIVLHEGPGYFSWSCADECPPAT